jgi:hypothetical protein
MKSNIFTFGIILLIIGLAAYLTSDIKIQEYQSLLGQVTLIISSEATEMYHTFQLMQILGGILSIVGVIVCIAGFIAKDESF